jgi:hypothetical protein
VLEPIPDEGQGVAVGRQFDLDLGIDDLRHSVPFDN